MSVETERDWIEEVGGPVYRSVESLVAALECDYDRLGELREERKGLEENIKDIANELDDADMHERDAKVAAATGALTQWDEDNRAELAELMEAAGECESRDDAEQRIHEDALSVEVRSGWYTPGDERGAAEEFNILLCTGGPAARIRGELDDCGEPTRAWLEVQNWGKPWTQYFKADQDVLLTYARCFYYGEG